MEHDPVMVSERFCDVWARLLSFKREIQARAGQGPQPDTLRTVKKQAVRPSIRAQAKIFPTTDLWRSHA